VPHGLGLAEGQDPVETWDRGPVLGRFGGAADPLEAVGGRSLQRPPARLVEIGRAGQVDAVDERVPAIEIAAFAGAEPDIVGRREQPRGHAIGLDHRGDAADLAGIADNSVHLIVTSPPYFNIKPYASDADGRQLGRIADYERFLDGLDAPEGRGSNGSAFSQKLRAVWSGLDKRMAETRTGYLTEYTLRDLLVAGDPPDYMI